jgi:hypothetical protein
LPRSTTLERASGAFAREQRFVRWARIGVLAITVGFTGNLLLLDTLARVFHDRVDNPDAAPRGLDALTTPLALAGAALRRLALGGGRGIARRGIGGHRWWSGGRGVTGGAG